MTKESIKDLIILARNEQWRYFLDQYENQELKAIQKYINQAKKNITRRLQGSVSLYLEESIDPNRAEALINELNKMTVGVKAQLGEDIEDIASFSLAESLKVHEDILSFGGRVSAYNFLKVSPEQVKSIVQTPVGGYKLKNWVNRVFDYPLQDQIKQDIAAGMFEGAPYKNIINRVEDGFNVTRREAITLVRTTTQTANVTAQEMVYKNNRKIVEKVKWSSALENGHKSGKGICIACAALDGNIYVLDDHPECPKHPRCRCILIPVTKTWRELWLDMDEIGETYRPYTLREVKNVDTGGNRKIIEIGRHKGDYASWFEKQSAKIQKNTLGPKRFELFKDDKINFKDLVNPRTGDLILLKELL